MLTYETHRSRPRSVARGTSREKQTRNHRAESPSGVAALLGQFAPINLADMDSVALLDRNDTKYVITIDQLCRALTALNSDYNILDIAGVRQHTYQTLYFDTANFALYMAHHAGRSHLYKVRSRQYVDSNLSFVEVKHKANNERTHKQRLRTINFVDYLSAEASDFVDSHLPHDTQTLEPKLWNTFSRVTLVSKQHQERVTLDLNLHFYSHMRTIGLSNVVVAEVKQDGIQRTSAFIQQMRAANIHEMGFSKYCIGVSLLYDHVKHNNFKSKLRTIHTLMERSH